MHAGVPIFTNTNIFIIQRNTTIGILQIMDTNTKKYRNTVPGAGRRAHIHKYKMGKLQIYSQIQRNTRLENYKQLQLKMPTTASGSPSFITSPKVGKVSQKCVLTLNMWKFQITSSN